MITITLQKIKDSSPCPDGWQKVLKAHEPVGMDTAFPLYSGWLDRMLKKKLLQILTAGE